MLNLKHVLRTPLYGVGDRLAMGSTWEKRLKNQHVQSSLDHLGL